MLAFGPRSFMLSLNGLAYGVMSASAFLAAFAFPGREQSFVRFAMRAHGAMGPIVIAAIFWPRMTYVGALWIVTFPAMTLALTGSSGGLGRQVGATAGFGRSPNCPASPHRSAGPCVRCGCEPSSRSKTHARRSRPSHHTEANRCGFGWRSGRGSRFCGLGGVPSPCDYGPRPLFRR